MQYQFFLSFGKLQISINVLELNTEKYFCGTA